LSQPKHGVVSFLPDEPMRILLTSHRFHPDIGGIESVSMILAVAFAEAGHRVVVVTQSAGETDPAWPFEVERQPRLWRLLQLVRQSDVVFQNNIGLQTAWPLLFVSRPWVVTSQTWLSKAGVAAKIKRWCLRYARRIYISDAIGQDVGLPGEVVGNPYDTSVFHSGEFGEVRGDVIFVGRLVSDKGADLLLDALAFLRRKELVMSLTIVGGGPEEKSLKDQAGALLPKNQVRFVGPLSGESLARALRGHQILVVPSRWAEPFGIVALEGIACSCVVVGSDLGGLSEVIGPCGVTFPNGDFKALAERLEFLQNSGERISKMQQQAASHLEKYQVKNVAQLYLRMFESEMK
jgi:glycogen synthase